MNRKTVKKLLCCSAAFLLLSASGARAEVDVVGSPEDGRNSSAEEGAILVDMPSEEVLQKSGEFEELWDGKSEEEKEALREAFFKNMEERVKLYVKLHYWKDDSRGKSELEAFLGECRKELDLAAYRDKGSCPANSCAEVLRSRQRSLNSNELRFYENEVVAYALRIGLREKSE